MKLIRGAPGTGKTALVFREFKEALRAGQTNPRIVVPTATLVRHFRHELGRDGLVFSPRSVISLNGFIAEHTPQRSRGETSLVPDGLLRAIVRDVLDRLRFPEFAAVAGTDGMAETIVDTLDLFENAGCTPERLAAVRKLGPHAKPFEKIWRVVRDAVRQAGYQMRGDWLRSAQSPLPSAHIWLDGFLAFSPIEREFLRTLSATCALTITTTDSPAADEIRRFALHLGAEERLLTGPPRKAAISLNAARTLEREADEIARRIISLHDQGTEFRALGVALRDAATYVPLLKAAFDRFGIPARFYFSSNLRQHPAAIFFGGIVSCALSGWDFESTLAALRAHPRWGTRSDFDRFDFAVRAALPNRGAAALLTCCEADWLREEIGDSLKIEAWATTPQKPADWLRRFESFGGNLYRPGQFEIPRDQSGIEAARSHVAALKAWVSAISSVAAFWDPDEPVSLAEFWRVATVAVDSAVLYPIDDRANVVHVMNVYEARQWNVESLLVCGMTDRDFPRQRTQNLLFPDADVDRLIKADIPLRKASDHENEERWLFDALCTRASGSIFLSYPEHDSSGKTIQPSRFLDACPHRESALLCRPEPRVPAATRASAGRIGSSFLHSEMARLHQTISLTSLEDLAQCRFKFFSNRTLSLKTAPERPEDRLTARVTGSILHVALERWLADKTRDFVELFEETFDETCRKEHLPPGYKLEVERIRYREIAQRVSANDLWNPDSSEAEVPLSMTFDISALDTRVAVTCRIDRIDRFKNPGFADDCVIVDYKSSKTANVEKLVTSRTRLQGPLYALAVRENLHLNPIAMLYWAVREDERYGWGEIPGVKLDLNPMPENWANDAKARTIERLSGFLTGRVEAHPEEAEQCRWCDYNAACRVNETKELVTIGRAAGVAGNSLVQNA
jgi:ATP-dependent helicase/DNAse subunit B